MFVNYFDKNNHTDVTIGLKMVKYINIIIYYTEAFLITIQIKKLYIVFLKVNTPTTLSYHFSFFFLIQYLFINILHSKKGSCHLFHKVL